MSNNIDDILENDPVPDDNSEHTESSGETDPQTTVPERSVPSSTSTSAVDELGHILASEEIHVSRRDNHITAFIRTEAREKIRLGDYVQIPYPDAGTELFAVTDGLRYEPYTDLDDKSDAHNQISSHAELDESEYVQLAELEPLAILKHVGTDDIESGIVNRIPKPNASTTLARDEDCLRTGLNIPHTGIFTGWLSVGGEAMTVAGDNFPYYLYNPGIDPDSGEIEDGEPAVFRHTLVAGSTGKGKTHFTKNILRQFVSNKRYPVRHHDTGERQQRRLNLVIFDPENEYWEMREDNRVVANDDAIQRTLRKHGITHGGVDDLEVFIPQIQGTNAPSTMQSRELTIPFELVRGRPEMLMPYQPTPVTRGAIEDCISAYFSCFEGGGYAARGVPRPTYTDFLSFLTEQSDEHSRLRKENDIGGGTWSAVNRRVDRGTFRAVFDHGTDRLPDISSDVFREGQVTVIPTSHLNGGKDSLTVLSILSYIIENKIHDYQVDSAVRDTPLLVAVDEAHNYFGNPETLREEYILDQARSAAKQGRKYKLGLFLITQNPDDIDDNVIKQINTNIFLGLKQDVVDDVASIPGEFKAALPNFQKGQAVIKAPDVEAVEVVGLPYCLTKHSN
jgi:DNA helicase HerA-like ATPase